MLYETYIKVGGLSEAHDLGSLHFSMTTLTAVVVSYIIGHSLLFLPC